MESILYFTYKSNNNLNKEDTDEKNNLLFIHGVVQFIDMDDTGYSEKPLKKKQPMIQKKYGT